MSDIKEAVMQDSIFKSPFTTILAITLLFSGASAFAQKGSVNGPEVTGPLNPASGATSIPLQIVLEAEGQCYVTLLKDMLDPFLGLQQLKETDITSNIYASVPILEREGLLVEANIKLKRADGTYATEIRNRFHKPRSVRVKLPALNQLRDQMEINVTQKNSYGDSLIASTLILGFPMLTYQQNEQVSFDSVVHTKSFSAIYANQIQKAFSGGLAPKDPTQIPVLNADPLNTPSNFRVNGKKFFECVESLL